MARAVISFLLLASAFQVYASHFPQLVVRGGLHDVLATPTPTLRPQLRLKRFDNGTVPSSSQDPESSPDPTPDTTTVIPVFTPPTTTISGAAETTAAKQIGPVIWGLWNKRNLLEDDNTKQEYIDLVDQTKNDVTALFNNLETKPDPPSECCQTSLKKRSLISAIGDALKTAADIVSCAECVVNNLDNVVKTVPPDIDIVDTLTDTLNDLKTKLDDLDNDDDDHSKSSGCTSATATDCTVELYESTTFFVTDDSTTSAVATSTTTKCQTITACDATGTTETTTTATSTTSSTSVDDVCGPNACGDGSCNNKRALPTPAPLPSTYPYPEIDPDTFFPYLNSSLDERHFLGKRDVRGPGSGDWSDFYNGLKSDSGNTLVDIFQGAMGTQTAVEVVSFNTGQASIMVEGLYGCTSVIIVDHRGAFVNHIWEDSGLKDVPPGTWSSDGTGLLSNYLNSYRGNTFTANAKVFIMVGATGIVDNDGALDRDVFPPTITDQYPTQAELDSLTQQGSTDKYPARTQALIDVIKKNIDGIADPTVWIYKRQTSEAIRNLGGGFGRAAVLYDPAQSSDPSNGDAQPADTGAWKVYIQGAAVGQDLWPNQELQIWRVNVVGGGQQQSANVLHIGKVGTVVDPCRGDLDPPVPDSESVNPGSEIIDIGPHAVGESETSSPQKFKITDANGNVWRDNCVFVGNGNYAPTADSGLYAGDLECDGGYTVQCQRPYNNQATTCGNQPLSDCDQGKLGSNCFPYNQLLATCRV